MCSIFSETCYDAFMDCDARIQENANFCEDVDNEGPRGCARTCRKCRKKPFTKGKLYKHLDT